MQIDRVRAGLDQAVQGFKAAEKWLYAWMMGAVAFGVASLLVPLYVLMRGGGAAELGVLAATAGIAGAVGGIGLGRYGDTVDRQRQLFLAVLVGSALVLAFIPFITATVYVLVLNAVLWCLFAAAGPVLTLLIVSGTEENVWHRRIAQLNTLQGYGWAAGLVLGMVWLAIGSAAASSQVAQQTLFLAAAVLAGAAGVFGGRWLPAPDTATVTGKKARRVAQFLVQTSQQAKGATFFLFSPTRLYWTTRAVRPTQLRERFTPQLTNYFLAATVFFTGIGMFFAPLPLFLKDVGFASDTIFGLYLLSSLGSAACYSVAGTLMDRYNIRRVQAAALGTRTVLFPGIAIAGLVLLSTLVGTVVMGIAFLLLGVTWAVIAVAATTLVTRLAPPQIRSDCLGIYTGLSAVAGAVGSLLGGVIAGHGHGYVVVFAAAGTFLLVAAVLILRVPVAKESDGVVSPETVA